MSKYYCVISRDGDDDAIVVVDTTDFPDNLQSAFGKLGMLLPGILSVRLDYVPTHILSIYGNGTTPPISEEGGTGWFPWVHEVLPDKVEHVRADFTSLAVSAEGVRVHFVEKYTVAEYCTDKLLWEHINKTE